MGDVTGPISTLPGHPHELPDGATCDRHPRRKAVANIQGETDSMGCETNYLCQKCLEELRAYNRSAESRTGKCDWCKAEATDLRDTRDYEEGMNGPVYRVCGPCRKRRDDKGQAYLDSLGEYDDDPYDD